MSPEALNEQRKKAVRLRLDGHTVAVVSQRTGLSAPTVSAAWKAFREGGMGCRTREAAWADEGAGQYVGRCRADRTLGGALWCTTSRYAGLE